MTTPEIARSLGKQDIVTVKALQLAVSNGWESQGSGWDGSYFHTTRVAASRAYRGGRHHQSARRDLADGGARLLLGHRAGHHGGPVRLKAGEGWKDVLDGFFDADGTMPCQIDGGLKCFGHPIGASGLRMIYENYLQLLGRAGARQRSKPPRLALSHNLGGMPNQNVSAVAIVGLAN